MLSPHRVYGIQVIANFCEKESESCGGIFTFVNGKNVRPLLVIALITDIYGNLRPFDTRIRFFAYTHPILLESEYLIILSSILMISFSSLRFLIYSYAASYRISRFKGESN